jgi:hypothetical protein
MLTIHHLEVHFDVAGDDDAVFARLFADHIRRWARQQEAESCRSRQLEQERSVGDDDPGEQPW